MSISRADPGADGRPLLLLAGVGSSTSPNRLYQLQQGSDMRLLSEHPLSRVSRVNAALWGDIDNDGLTDVYFLRDGENQLWRPALK